MYVLLGLALLFIGCQGSGNAETDDGASAAPETVRTRTVCVAGDEPDMLEIAQKTVDTWNDRATDPICTECQDWDRCLCKAVLHELGHALGIHGHTQSGMMHALSIRSPTQGLHRSDIEALPHNAPYLLVVDDDETCVTRIDWGYPAAAVHPDESAWYERSTRDIWLDPNKRWIY